MSIEQIKQLEIPAVRSQHLVTGLAGIFALVSTQNVAHFFKALGHDPYASWTIGFALGVALVVLAHQLSECDMRIKQAFYSLLSVTGIFTILSGLIQGTVYAEHLGWLGYLLAFVLISCSELALPIAVSITEESKRKAKVLNAGTAAREKGAEILVGVLDFDQSKLKRQAEKIMQEVVLANLSQIAEEMTPRSKRMVAAVATLEGAEAVLRPDMSQGSLSPLGIGAHPDEMNEIRADKVQRRLDDILSQVDGQDVGTFKAAMAERHTISVRQIERDLRKLEDGEQIVCNGVVMRVGCEIVTEQPL